MSLHLKRRFVQEFVQNHGRRVQNLHFRLTRVAQKRRCSNSLIRKVSFCRCSNSVAVEKLPQSTLVCALYLGVNVFSTKVLILRRDRHFTWSSVLREGLTAKAVPSFLSYFKTLSIGPAPGIETASSRWTVKHSIDWTNPVAVFSVFSS